MDGFTGFETATTGYTDIAMSPERCSLRWAMWTSRIRIIPRQEHFQFRDTSISRKRRARHRPVPCNAGVRSVWERLPVDVCGQYARTVRHWRAFLSRRSAGARRFGDAQSIGRLGDQVMESARDLAGREIRYPGQLVTGEDDHDDPCMRPGLSSDGHDQPLRPRRTLNVAHTDLVASPRVTPQSRLRVATRFNPLPRSARTCSGRRTGTSPAASWTRSSMIQPVRDNVTVKGVWAWAIALPASSLAVTRTGSTSRKCRCSMR
jgi:hypothetical protein